MGPGENIENLKNDNFFSTPQPTKAAINKLHFIILTEEGAFE